MMTQRNRGELEGRLMKADAREIKSQNTIIHEGKRVLESEQTLTLF